jgi:hypothetical protein
VSVVYGFLGGLAGGVAVLTGAGFALRRTMRRMLPKPPRKAERAPA